MIDDRKNEYCSCLGVPGGRIIESICTLRVGLKFFFSFLLTMIGYYQTKISKDNAFQKKKRKNVRKKERMVNRVLSLGYGIIH